jgi:hypothetical protein
MKIIDHKDAINRRLYNHQFFVETPIYEPALCRLERTGVGNKRVVATGVASLALTEAYWMWWAMPTLKILIGDDSDP